MLRHRASLQLTADPQAFDDPADGVNLYQPGQRTLQLHVQMMRRWRQAAHAAALRCSRTASRLMGRKIPVFVWNASPASIALSTSVAVFCVMPAVCASCAMISETA